MSEASGHGVPAIDVAPLRALLVDEAATQVIDVRDDWEWAQGHIDGARHIPLAELPGRLGEIDPARDAYFVCHLGGRSEMATRFAHQHGLSRAVNVAGGMDAWQARGYPVTA